jgi:N-acetylglucosaminyldiphosphoundecaprenol N-acetyl-beta-D-mannosaminyltransferase
MTTIYEESRTPSLSLWNSSPSVGLSGLDVQVVHAPVRRLFGLPVHALTMGEVIQLCERTIDSRKQLMIGVVNAAKIVNMKRMPALAEAVLQSNLVLADGMAVVWASHLLGQPLPERVTGIDLFEELLKLANQRGYSVYLLGASLEVVGRVSSHIASKYPNVRLAGVRDGYFKDSQAEEIAQEIRIGQPDMVFLGMTSPKKEMFLAQWGEFIAVPICHGVGGSFDVIAGKVKRAPESWQKSGLEWFYRVVQEPRRMWRRYLVTNMVFLGMLLRELLRGQISLSPKPRTILEPDARQG